MGFTPTEPEHLSEEGKDFLRKCFVQNPRERATAEYLLDHPFTKVRTVHSQDFRIHLVTASEQHNIWQ